MITLTEALDLVKFTPEEVKSLTKLEATIDAALYAKFDGSPIRIQFPETISPKLAHGIQRKYEQPTKGGSWRVAVEVISDKCTFTFTPMVFSLPEKTKKENQLPTVLPAITNVPVSNGNRLLVRMPTRSRPEQAVSVLAKYRLKAGMPITLEVVLDKDDDTMLDPLVLQRLNALGCQIVIDEHHSKVDACNHGKHYDFDVILLASDDMVPVKEGYAVRVMQAMEENFPHLDGAIYFNDGYQDKNICTLPILGRRLYDQFGEVVYEPEYQSLFCDTEQTELLTSMGRLVYIDEKLIEHRHHVVGAPNDDLYKRNDALWQQDKMTYESRKNRVVMYSQFGFESPPLWLSICIASLPSRKPRLNQLVDYLYKQIIPNYSREVEILVDNKDNLTIGAKRQSLLEKAKGHFVCFIDDDDWVSHDYVSKIVNALCVNPNVDCVSFKGVMTTSGQAPEYFENSLKYSEWFCKDGLHCRTPSHLTPVRRTLALQSGFKSVSHAEDHDFSMRLRPLLKTEVAVEGVLYYYWYWPTKQNA